MVGSVEVRFMEEEDWSKEIGIDGNILWERK